MVAIASFGGGTNSAAMLIGMVERGEPAPYAVLFADTGGEHPHTYRFIAEFSAWLIKKNYPPVTLIRKGGRKETLEESCLRLGTLPSIAYGFKTCSLKFKVEPQEKWANNDANCLAAWAEGHKITKLIGFDADEPHRAKFTSDAKYVWRYPLLEWEWGRDECVAAIDRELMTRPGKSSCFFCPNMRKAEILALRANYPELLSRALNIESNAKLTAVKGLGRRFSWREFIDGSPDTRKSMPDNKDSLCECYDGQANELI